MDRNRALYLRSNVVVEPLVDHWYAWSHLIPPVTAARNMTQRHMRIMDSYIRTPSSHADAVKDPKMLGGPFIDYDGGRVEEIQALRDRTLRSRADQVELSQAVALLDALLAGSAKGYALRPLYDQIPKILQGFVELVYDLNSHPSFRLIEPLLYKSRLYDPTRQTVMLSMTTNDDRPFVLSTPRLESPGSVHLSRPFCHNTIDQLSMLKDNPHEWHCIKDLLELPDCDDTTMLSLLTPEPPPKYQSYCGPGIRWRYFGHACILVETSEASILLDPVISYSYQTDIPRYTYHDLPSTIDFVLVTHNHQDHLLFETLLQIRHKVRHIIVPRGGRGQLQDPSLKLILENCGFPGVQELGEMEVLRQGPIVVTGIPFFGEHADLDIASKMAWHVRIGEYSMLFASDSCNIAPQLYAHVHREVGDIDVLFLGMECDGAPLSWLYGPLLTHKIPRDIDNSRRLSGSDADQGMRIIHCFHCKQVYIYAMGQEPWLNYIMSIKYTAESRPIRESRRLLEACAEAGIEAERLFGEREIFVGCRA